MVGTAYRSPEPGAASFIEVGSKVSQGQTLLIIEAMKTMNQIPAPRSGTVTAILFENAPAGRIRRAARHHRVGSRPFRLIAIHRRLACPVESRADNVRQSPDRQPRRDRAAHPARVQGTRHRDRRRAFDRRRRRHARAPRRRERLHRPAARRRKLSQHSAPARRLRDHRRRRDPSRLRLPVGERPLRRDPRRAQHHLHRPDVRAHPHHGRQDRGQGNGQEARHSGRAGLRRRRDQRSARP